MMGRIKHQGFTLIEVCVVLIIGVMVIASGMTLMSYSHEIKKEHQIAIELITLTTAVKSYLAVEARVENLSATQPKEIDLSDLKNSGFLNSTFPDSNYYHQHYHVLLKLQVNSQGDHDVARPIAMIFTTGGQEITSDKTAELTGFVGGQAGYVFPKSNGLILGINHGWQSNVRDWDNGTIKPEEGHPLVFVQEINKFGANPNVDKPQLVLDDKNITCSSVGQPQEIGSCNDSWMPVYAEDYLLLKWAQNSSTSDVLVEITVHKDDENKTSSIYLHNTTEYRLFATRDFINARVDVQLTPLAKNGTRGNAINYMVQQVRIPSHPFKLFKLAAQATPVVYPDNKQTQYCLSPEKYGQLLSLLSIDFHAATSTNRPLHYLFPLIFKISESTEQPDGNTVTQDIYQQSISEVADQLLPFTSLDPLSSVDIANNECASSAQFNTTLSVVLFVDNKQIANSSSIVKWGSLTGQLDMSVTL